MAKSLPPNGPQGVLQPGGTGDPARTGLPTGLPPIVRGQMPADVHPPVPSPMPGSGFSALPVHKPLRHEVDTPRGEGKTANVRGAGSPHGVFKTK